MSNEDAAGSATWQWTVEDRFTIPGRGVVVVGEHRGVTPTMNESCRIEAGGSIVYATVGGINDMSMRDDDGRSIGRQLGLVLRGVTVSDVALGAVVSPRSAQHAR